MPRVRWWFWLLLGGLSAACQGLLPLLDTPTPPPVVASVTVQVQAVQVEPGPVPGTYRAVVRGVLPNPCAGLPEHRLVREENTFILTLVLPQDLVACPATPTPFEVAVPLPTEGLPPGTYTVLVHGLSAAFVLEPGIAAAPTPTPTRPEPAASPSPSVSAAIEGEVWEDRCTLRDGEPAAECRLYPGLGYAGDGVRQPDEPPLAGILVNITRGACPSGPLVGTTSTDPNGAFRFDGLEPGTYCVAIDDEQGVNRERLPAGVWTQPQPNQGFITVELEAGQVATVRFARFPNAEGFLPASTPTPTATSTTAPTGEPLPDLGPATLVDAMDNPAARWFLVNQEEARFVPEDGRLVMYAYDLGYTNYWGLSAYPPLQDAYLEGVFITGPECQGRDRYGFIVRAPSPEFGIVVLASCSGEVLVFRWDGEYNPLRNWTPVASLNAGPNQTNRLGVWMEGTTLKIYVNRVLAFQVEDDVYTEGGFGLVVGAERTRGFWAAVDEVAYWTLP